MTLFQFPVSLPFAAFLNLKLLAAQGAGFASIYDGMKSAYPGDPMANTLIPNTALNWDNTTLCQGLIYDAYVEMAEETNPFNPNGILPSNLGDILAANPGPDAPWNFSYAQLGIGPNAALDPSLKQVNIVNVASGQVVTGILIP